MRSNVLRGVITAGQTAVAGALAFTLLDRLINNWLTFGLNLGFLWLEAQTFLLLCGTAVAATVPFAVLGGCILGAVTARVGQARYFSVVGVALGVIAMLGGFSVVYYGVVCVTSHGLCYQDPIGWVDWSVQRDFLSGRFFYPGRLALSTLLGAIGGWWAAQRMVTSGQTTAARQASA